MSEIVEKDSGVLSSKSAMTEISETDYKKVKLLFKKFNCKSVVQYLIYYCTINVYMMCEAFEFPGVNWTQHGILQKISINLHSSYSNNEKIYFCKFCI